MGDRLVVSRTVKDTVSAGGIVLAHATDIKPFEGVVIAIGPNVKALRPGNLVAFGRHAGQQVEIDGDPVVLLREDEVLGVL
jgi:chaperonin GroES